jgi:hypothetical protein
MEVDSAGLGRLAFSSVVNIKGAKVVPFVWEIIVIFDLKTAC